MKLLIPLLLAGFVITACAPMNVATEVMVEENSEEIKVQTAEPMLEATAEVMPDEALELPTWLTSELVNIKTGETFKLTDFAGKVVLVENLAMWCSSCLKQQEQVKLLHEQLGEDSGLISIGFDVDQNEEAEDLKKY
ncbi:MAG: hypothetical protein Q8R87_01930, partial [Anaerolineaceae bacterium]|nr:hypothetical protein [Anaerolineaceae bacterium]